MVGYNGKLKTLIRILDLPFTSCIILLLFSHSFVRVWLCNPSDWGPGGRTSMPGFPVQHQLLEPTKTHVHHVGDTIQPSHPLLSPSPPTFSLSQHQGLFSVSRFFASGDKSIGVSASASVLPVNIQDWFPLGWTDWISLQSKGLSRVCSNTTVQKHQFFSTQVSL